MRWNIFLPLSHLLMFCCRFFISVWNYNILLPSISSFLKFIPKTFFVQSRNVFERATWFVLNVFINKVQTLATLATMVTLATLVTLAILVNLATSATLVTSTLRSRRFVGSEKFIATGGFYDVVWRQFDQNKQGLIVQILTLQKREELKWCNKV